MIVVSLLIFALNFLETERVQLLQNCVSIVVFIMMDFH